jgi:transmembrane sensor
MRPTGEDRLPMIDRLTRLFAARPTTAEGWLARMGRPGVGPRDEADFLDWLEREEDHLRQYEAAKADLASLEGLRSALAPDLQRLKGHRWPAGPVSQGRRWVIAGGALAAVAAGVLVLRPVLAPDPVAAGEAYRSAPGQIRDVVLADGSHVTLDADSAIRVLIGRDARRVSLERGAAYFEVVHDARHPFQVAAADRFVIVTGTRFVASLDADGAEVSLLEGHVAIGRHDVRERDALKTATRLSPGEKARYETAMTGIRLDRADVELETAWRNRRLVFRDAPMSQVIAAVGRYSSRPLVIADPRLETLRVTAVLPLDGDGDLIARMDRLFPIRAELAPEGEVLIRAE